MLTKVQTIDVRLNEDMKSVSGEYTISVLIR